MTTNFPPNTNKKFIILVIGIIILIALNIVLIFISVQAKINKKNIGQTESVTECLDAVNAIRISGHQFCKPLLMVNIPHEASQLISLKEKIQNFIQSEKTKNEITDASVYFKMLNNGSWISVNDDEMYYPASMFKLPILIAVLKLSETESNLLQQSIVFDSEQPEQRDIRNEGNYMVKGNKYTVKELLNRMIINSDNEAANILVGIVKVSALQSLCDALQIKGNPGSIEFQVSASDMSKLMRLLYNSSYLNPENSDFALNLLTETKYSEGIRKNIDPNIIVAHKFGERNLASDPQLHETAIIYLQGNPVLLTIMTKGNDYNKLSGVIAELSKLILSDIIQNQNAYTSAN